MKRFSRHVCVIFAMFLLFPLSAFAGWVLYDDFNSGQIDDTKWGISTHPDAAPVSVVDGAAKFVLDTNKKNRSSFLNILQSPEKVKAIRAKVKFESRIVNVRGRIAGYVGTDPNGDLVWTQINLQQSINNNVYNQFAWYGMSTIDAENTSIDVKSYLYGEFPRPLAGTYPDPIDLTGEWVTLEISFNPAKFTYGLPDPDLNWYLKNYKPLTKVKKYDKDTDPDFLFKGIGVRANSGAPDGQECVVYFDDVYVLK